MAGLVCQDRAAAAADGAEHGAARHGSRPPSSGRTASGCRRRRRPGTTWPGSPSSGAVRSCSRECPGLMTPSARWTPGVSAISVSNHGGNNLDGTPATIRALPAVADAVGSQVEVLLDGGVRRGSDVVKALALGARAVMIGRAYLWGLAAGGQARSGERPGYSEKRAGLRATRAGQVLGTRSDQGRCDHPARIPAQPWWLALAAATAQP